MSNFVQKVKVEGVGANLIIEEALRRNGVREEFLRIPEVRDEIINCLKAAQIKKNKYTTLVTKGDLIENIDEVISDRLDIKPDSVRVIGNNYSEEIGEDRNEASTKKVSFEKTPKGVKRTETRVVKVFSNNMREISDPLNYMDKTVTVKLFGASNEIVEASSSTVSTRDNVNGLTKMNRNFKNIEISGRKGSRITRGKQQEYATLDSYEEVSTIGTGDKKEIKIRETNYRLKGNELTDLIEPEEVQKILFSRLRMDDFYESVIERKFINDREETTTEQLVEEIQGLEEDKQKIAMRMFGARIPNNPEFQEGIGENQ